LQTDFVRLKEILKQRDKLIEDSGLILYTDSEQNSQITTNEIRSVLPAALVAPETAKLLDAMGEGTIDDKLRKLLENKSDLKEQNSRLRSELEDERIRISSLEKKLANQISKIQDSQDNAQDLHEIQRQYTKEINEFKMRNQKLDHENIVIKQDLQRLQTQLKYMQTNFDEIEQSEQRLNKEKREAQREVIVRVCCVPN
jgi:chromosome segregation ATPase